MPSLFRLFMWSIFHTLIYTNCPFATKIMVGGGFVAKALTWVFKATVNSQDCVPNVLVNNIIDINGLVYGV